MGQTSPARGTNDAGVPEADSAGPYNEYIEAEVEPGNPDTDTFTFRGGTTLLINRQGEVRFSISKPIDGPAGEERLERQRSFLRRSADSFALAPYVAFDAERDLGFCGIHRGY